MQKSLVRKGLVLGILIVFIGASIIPSIGGSVVERRYLKDNKTLVKGLNFEGNILYVGGTGSGNYTSIQDAIDDASNGDLVFVYDRLSPYTENIMIIGKSITLMGEDKGTTIIQSYTSNNTIYINANNVIVLGFSIMYSNYSGIYLSESEDCSIYLNNIKYNYYGIMIDDSSNNNLIYNNNFEYNIENAYDEGDNKWSKPFPTGGNYWYDYEDRYPNAKKILWFWDTPYEIPGGDMAEIADLLPHVYYLEMSKDKSYNNNFNMLNRFFEKLPNIFQILINLLRQQYF